METNPSKCPGLNALIINIFQVLLATPQTSATRQCSTLGVIENAILFGGTRHLLFLRFRTTSTASKLTLKSSLRKGAFFFQQMADEFDLSSNFIPSLYKSASLLPIARHRQSLLYLIETYPVTIVVGQTGSGKSTQIPQFLEQIGWCQDGKVIAVTQVCKSSVSWAFPCQSDI